MIGIKAKYQHSWRMSILLAIFALILWACPSPFEEAALSTLQDLLPPTIRFLTPELGSSFESSVTITGRIIDIDKAGMPRTGRASAYITSASYSIEGEQEHDLALDDSGIFTFSLPTAHYTTQIAIKVMAKDLNGNQASATMSLVPDKLGPLLVVTSPGDYSEYATVISLSGYVRNSVADDSISEVARTVSYSMPGTNKAGILELDAAGAFATTIDVSTLSGTRTVELTARDLNSNASLALITIVKPAGGGDISGFSVMPGDRRVSIQWEPVPHAESYTIREWEYGASVTGLTTTTYDWEGLENGTLYSFQVTAHIPSGLGPDAMSAEVQKIPLSPLSLVPHVTSRAYRSIGMTWADYEAISRYSVERSPSRDGPWEVVRKTSSNTFLDEGLAADAGYFYRVSPSSQDDIKSAWVAAAPGRFISISRSEIATLSLGGYTASAACRDGYVYAACGTGGLAVIDVREPGSPRIASRLTGLDARDIALNGDYAYIAAHTGGLRIVDVSNPSSPIGVATVPGSFSCLDVSGTKAIISSFNGSTLTIIDVSDPSAPTTIGSLGSMNGWRIKATPGRAYLTRWNTGLTILDTSDPDNIVSLSTTATSDWAVGIALQGDHAFIADNTAGLRILNVSNPSTPSSIGSCATGGTAMCVALRDDYAYVAATTAGLAFVDVSTPAAPTLLGTCLTSGSPGSVCLEDSHAYLTKGNDGLSVVDIAKPYRPSIASSTSNSTAQDIAIAGDIAYVARSSDPFCSFDISTPSAPIMLSSSSAATGRAVIALGDLIYVTDGENGLKIFSSDAEGTLAHIGTCDTPLFAYGLAIKGPYAYVANYSGSENESNGISIIDIADPRNPNFLRTFPIGIATYDIAIKGSHAYVVSNAGLVILDLTDPIYPVPVITVPSSGGGRGLAVSGDYAYIASMNAGLRIVDISNPSLATVTATQATTGNAYGVDVAGDFAFVAVYDKGIEVIDIANPASPIRVGGLDTAGNAVGVTVAGRYAYLAEGRFTVIDLLGGEE